MSDTKLDPGSFRDRESRIFHRNGEVYRLLSPTARSEWQALRKTDFFSRLVEAGDLVATEEATIPAGLEDALPSAPAGALRHDTIPFVSYPYEWSFGMLQDAALLQLRVLNDALEEGFTLKDATPYNVQWEGAHPRFIDLGSFEELRTGDPWVAYLQFCQLFLYPLLLTAHKGIPFHPWLRGSLEGISPETCRRLFSFWDLLRPGVLFDVWLQAKVHHKADRSNIPLRTEIQRSGFSPAMILRNVRRLERIISRLSFGQDQSEWSNYAGAHSYNEHDISLKQTFIAGAASSRQWRMLWDLGCNTGEMTRVAAKHADYTVAIDRDALAIDRLYRQLKAATDSNILTLVMDLADPSPGLGWRNSERRTLADRGLPDLVLCLALLHHLVLTANIPLPEILDWLVELGGAVVLEFVHREDPMVRRLLRNKVDNYGDYQRNLFETGLKDRFRVRDQVSLSSGTRTLYFAEPLHS